MSLQNLDNFISTFSKGIVDLNYYEAIDRPENLVQHSEVFQRLQRSLHKRHKFALDQDLWKELYHRSVYFYKYQNEVNGVHLKLVTKHNQIIPFYMSQRIHNTATTLVHFDTHSDEAPVKNSVSLPSIYQSYLDTNDERYLGEAIDIVWDIGAANSGILFATGIRDVTWCLPSWVPDKQITLNTFLKKSKKSLTLSTTDNIAGMNNLDEMMQVSHKPKDAPSALYTKVQTGKLSSSGLTTLIDAIKRNGRVYFLDIDLDYIVCNGKPFNTTYWKDTYDLSSHHRTQTAEPNQSVPRYNGDATKNLAAYNRAFSREIKEIDQRIHKLFKLLFHLKKRGLTPSLISVCDSTNLQFANCETLKLHSCNSVSNNYVPLNIALYVHSKVMEKLFILTK